MESEVAGVSWTVRLAGEADHDGVEQVLKSAYPILFAPAYDSALLARTLAVITRPNPSLLASGRYFVAERDGRLLACGGWSHDAMQGAGSRPGLAHLRHFATHASWSNMGIGRSLYRASEAQCRSEEVAELEVVSTLNGEAFYRALGFEKIGPVEQRIAGLVLPAIRLRKDL